MIPKHVKVGIIELVNVPLGVVANTSASPVQSDPKLDEFLWHVAEESGLSSVKNKKSNSLFYLKNTVIFSLSPVPILGELASLSMKYTLVTALQLGRLFVDSLPIIGRRCRSLAYYSQ